MALDFRLWEARRRKEAKGQLMLFGEPPPEAEPEQEPEHVPDSPATANQPKSEPVKRQQGNLTVRAVRVTDLMNQSRRDPEKKFTVRSPYGRAISVKDIHPMRGNGRVVGYDDRGHRYLVSRNALNRVLYYPNVVMPQVIGWCDEG